MNLDELKRTVLELTARVGKLEREFRILREAQLESAEEIGQILAREVRASERPTEPAPPIPPPAPLPRIQMGVPIPPPPKRR